MDRKFPQPGEQMETWFSGRKDKLSRVIAVLPYTGKYPESFDCVLRLSADGTRRGYMEMTWSSREYERDFGKQER
jgi:hypothetical protein